MNTICYLFIFIFEQFISYLYFNNKFDKRRHTVVVIFSYIISFVFQYAISLLNTPYLNLISFFIANSVVVIICFNAEIKQIIFNVFILATIMISTELLAMYAFSTFLGIDLLACRNNDLILFLETATTKSLYFLVAFLISKKGVRVSKNIRDYSILLFVLPVSSIISIVSFSLLSFKFDIDRNVNLLFTITTFIFLFSNVIVFLIHEKIIDTLTENAELQLEQQKEKINKEYYDELERQNDSSNILIHDIKQCLSNIKALSNENDNKKITEYVDSIYKGYEISSLKQFSKNKLVNVIVSRYSKLCANSGIELLVDIRDVDFSFITDSDLTALLDNLLENSYEAAKQSSKKEVEISIDRRNENYILVETKNSSDIIPKVKGTTIVSTKAEKKFHGLGTKSISRIVKRYNGNIEFSYIKESNTFIVSILLKCHSN